MKLNNMDNDLIQKDINEIADLLTECMDSIDSIWASDKDYLQCSSAVLKVYSKYLGKISAKITAMKINAKRGYYNEETNNNIH